jgi:hypothetical protein
MKFFTPDAYMRYNSPDNEVADRAEADWERAIEDYNQHLAALPLRESVKRLSTQCFHDALLLDKTTHSGFSAVARFSMQAYSTILLQDPKRIMLLSYVGADVFSVDPDPKWQLAKLKSDQKLWLYDEVDAVKSDPEKFVHRILWSDGSVLAIHFWDVSIVSAPFSLDRSLAAAKAEHSLASAGES